MHRERYEIDPAHSSLTFGARHMVVSKVRGRFTRWSGSLEIDQGHPDRSQVETSIEAASIETGVADRDVHLRSNDFLATEKFPLITFRSRIIERSNAKHFRMFGDLTICGVTREVLVDGEIGGIVRDPWGKERVGFSAMATVRRSDFGLTWNRLLESGGLLVADEIDVEIEIEAVRVEAASQAA